MYLLTYLLTISIQETLVAVAVIST